jgi:hypothetical protein
MKKTSIFLGLLTMSLFASAQVRTSLYEEFTGENCNPCAATNPALNVTLANNSNLVIPIKWQVPIPSAPTTTWSLYQTDKPEIDWRYRSTANGGYGYPSQNTATDVVTSGVNSAPSGRFDGQHQWAFGATSDHPFYVSNAVIASAQSQTTNFSINMSTNWSPSFTNCVVSVTVTSSASFTSNGALMFRLCLVERTINFPSAPGSNGEKDFYDPVRQSYPTTMVGASVTAMGTPLSNTWIPTQSQTFTVNCNIPNYIYNYGQMAFVGFIQDDGNRKVYQAARTAQPLIPNDAQAMSVSFPSSVTCSSTLAPTATLKNNGANAITAMTVTPYMNLAAGTPVIWTGTLAPGASTTINMGVQTAINGTNTFSIFISGVSGGDIVQSNNGVSKYFFNTASYSAVPVVEGFVGVTFPPAGWASFNPTSAPYTWERSTAAGAYGTSSEAARVFINWTQPGGTHDLYLPGTNLTGTVNPVLKFDMSYTQIAAGNNDKLEVWVSTNCGATWTSAWSNMGNAMATTPPNNTQLNIPTAAQWTTVTVPLSTYSNSPGVLVRFTATSGQGNVIWLDNVNLNNVSPTGVALLSNAVNSFEIYPNPAANEVNVSVISASAGSSQINITNTLGQVVVKKEVSLNAGSNLIEIDTRSLASGIYYVTYGCAKGSATKKLTITK